MYRPYLISGFQTGKDIGSEPWLTPADAFPTLINARVNKGVLEKRNGYSLFAQMKHGSTAQTTTTIMGIFTYLKRGLPQLLICDEKRVNRYYNSPTTPTMTDITGATPSDIFSGKTTDFFHYANFLSRGYMTNNKDRIYMYKGTGNVEVFNIQMDSDGDTNQVDTCQFIFIKNDRMILLNTVEGGDWYPNRARVSDVTTAEETEPVFTSDISVDAPTSARIVTANWVGNHIGVWFNDNTFWLLKTYPDSTLPFVWDKIKTAEGVRSPYSAIPYKDGVVAVGTSNIVFFDGYDIRNLDEPKLRDIVSTFENSKIRYCFGYDQNEERHLVFTYAATDSTYPDRLLDYNTKENNFSIHKSGQSFFISCLGAFDGQKVPLTVDIDLVYTGADGALVSAMDVGPREVLGDPQPYTLIGCRNGRVYKWNDGDYDGTDDSSGEIEIDIKSARLNPFIKQGRKAWLGKARFLVDTDSNASALISYYKDMYSTAYRTQTLDCTGRGSGYDKSWINLGAFEQGDFHRLGISHTERGNRPRIHAIELYFKPGGPL
jgi:hypothetical protein